MPIYDYECPKCLKVQEHLEELGRNISRQCVPCNVFMVKKLSIPNFAFRGSGFYKTDYKDRGK